MIHVDHQGKQIQTKPWCFVSSFLCDFICEDATTMNYPTFYIKDQNPQNQILHHTEKMNVNTPSPRKERKRILRDNNLCYICYESTTHAYKTCNADMKWLERDSERHRTAMPLRMVANQQEAHGTHCSPEQE